MDHAYIEQQALVERYFRGDLPAAEEAAFEEHFFACERCQEDLEAARELRRGLQSEAAREATGPAVDVAIHPSWWSRRPPFQLGLMAAALLVALALPSWWTYSRYQQLDERAKNTAAALRRDLEAERHRAAQIAETLAIGESAWKAERQGLEERLAESAQTATTPPPAGLSRPLADVAVYLLAAVRDSAAAPALVKPGSAFTLAVDAGADAAFDSYRVTVVDSSGQHRFSRDGLQLNALEVVMVTFPADFLPPGDYRLDLTGLDTGEAPSPLSSHTFRVLGD